MQATVVTLMALAMCLALVLVGAVPVTSTAYPAGSGSVASAASPPREAASTGSAPRPTTTAVQGLPGTGRTFSYGYDLASVGTYGDPAAPTAVAARTTATTIPGTLVDVPIMGWGVGDPEIAPGTYDFSQIAKRIAFVQATGGVPVITLCGAPDWMKGGQPGVTDWSQIDAAPLPQYYSAFAQLSAAVASAFPQVRYFVVWKELKGFWDAATNSWDGAGYSTLYNDVYRAIKGVRPDADVGGPYVALQSHSGPANPARPTPTGPWGTLRPKDLDVVSYWLANAAGADFLAVDGTAFTADAGLTTDPLGSTAKYAAVDAWLRQRTTLPIVWMESHLLPDPTVADPEHQAALPRGFPAPDGIERGERRDAVEPGDGPGVGPGTVDRVRPGRRGQGNGARTAARPGAGCPCRSGVAGRWRAIGNPRGHRAGWHGHRHHDRRHGRGRCLTAPTHGGRGCSPWGAHTYPDHHPRLRSPASEVVPVNCSGHVGRAVLVAG